jgi:2-oxoglutarate ferredoxin oxidoreductase subunit beta
VLYLNHGEPMIFGKEKNKGIRLRGLTPEVVTIGENGVTIDDILVHDEAAPTPSLAYFLTQLNHPDFPVPVGVFRDVHIPTYEALVAQQIADSRKVKIPTLDDLLSSGETWEVT